MTAYQVGDEIVVMDSDGNKYTVTVCGIVEQNLFHREATSNTLLLFSTNAVRENLTQTKSEFLHIGLELKDSKQHMTTNQDVADLLRAYPGSSVVNFVDVNNMQHKADGRQLLKSEQSRTPEEQPRKRSHRPAFPKWTGIALAALVLASALGTAAFFLLGGSPNDLPSLSGAGGNPGQSDSALLAQDSASADNLPVYLRMEQPDVAEWVTNPTRSIQWKGYTLTAEKQLHDSATGSGVLIYSLENPDGIPKFETNDTGEVWFPDGDLVDISHFHKNYIVKEQTTKTKLTVACFYRQVEMNEPLEELYDPNLELTLSEYAACSLKEMEKMAQKLTTDAEFEQWAQTLICPETISIPLDKLGNLGTVKAENGAIVLSPISLFIDAANMEFLTTSTGINVQSLALRFQDGTQYVIKNGDSVNCAYEALEPRLDPQNPYRVIPPDKDPEGLGYKEYNWMPQNAVTYLLDRMVDITKAEAIIINGTEITLT